MINKRKWTGYAALSTVAFTATVGIPAIIVDAAIVFSGSTTVQGELRITTPTQLTDQTSGGALNQATVILAPTTPGTSLNLTGINPANLVIENSNVGTLTVSPEKNLTVTVLPGVPQPAVTGGTITFVSPQAAPTNLTGVAPTVMGNDGNITGITTAMEYRLKGATTFTPATTTEITGLVAGTYEVRFAAKTGYAAGAITQVVVPAYAGPSAIPVTGITLNQPTVADLEVGTGAIEAKKTVQLTATVSPIDATNQAVTWTSSNPAVATVSNAGLVTAVGAGSATITATTVNGKTATSEITVTSKTAVAPSIINTATNAGNGKVNRSDKILGFTLQASSTQESGTFYLVPSDTAKTVSAIQAAAAASAPITTGDVTLTVSANNANIVDNKTYVVYAITSNDTISEPSSAAFTTDLTSPTIATATIASNNAIPTLAKVGDEITLTFIASEAVNTPTANIAGKRATVAATANPNEYTAKVTVDDTYAETAVTYSVSVTDLAGNSIMYPYTTGVTGSVLVDRKAVATSAVSEQDRVSEGGLIIITFTEKNLPLSTREAIKAAISAQVNPNADGPNANTVARDVMYMWDSTNTVLTIINNDTRYKLAWSADATVSASNFVDAVGNISAVDVTIDLTSL